MPTLAVRGRASQPLVCSAPHRTGGRKGHSESRPADGGATIGCCSHGAILPAIGRNRQPRGAHAPDTSLAITTRRPPHRLARLARQAPWDVRPRLPGGRRSDHLSGCTRVPSAMMLPAQVSSSLGGSREGESAREAIHRAGKVRLTSRVLPVRRPCLLSSTRRMPGGVAGPAPASTLRCPGERDSLPLKPAPRVRGHDVYSSTVPVHVATGALRAAPSPQVAAPLHTSGPALPSHARGGRGPAPHPAPRPSRRARVVRAWPGRGDGTAAARIARVAGARPARHVGADRRPG